MCVRCVYPPRVHRNHHPTKSRQRCHRFRTTSGGCPRLSIEEAFISPPPPHNRDRRIALLISKICHQGMNTRKNRSWKNIWIHFFRIRMRTKTKLTNRKEKRRGREKRYGQPRWTRRKKRSWIIARRRKEDPELSPNKSQRKRKARKKSTYKREQEHETVYTYVKKRKRMLGFW